MYVNKSLNENEGCTIYRPPYRYRTINANFSVIDYRLDKKIWPINNALFPSETLQMCTVRHDGFEMLEI